MKKLLVLLGAMALTFTLATAEGKCNGQKCDSSKKETKCNGSKKDTKKCSASEKDTKKCNGSKKDTKEAPKKGKCGQGKCG